MKLRHLLIATLFATPLLAGPHEEAIIFVSENLLADQPIVVERQEDHQLHARLLSWSESLGRYFQGDKARAQEIALAEKLLPLVRDFQDPTLNRAVRYHVKRMIKHYGAQEPFVALRREVVASRLGISAEELASLPELEELVLANHLDIRFCVHGHKVTYDNRGRPTIPYEGVYLPVSAVLTKIPVNEDGQIVSHLFNFRGFVEGDVRGTLNPFTCEECRKPQLEIVTSECGTLAHAWLRIRADDGRVYSVGQIHGAIQSPDPVEYMAQAREMMVIAIPLTAEQSNQLLTYAAELQRLGVPADSQPDSCVFVHKMCAQIGLDDWQLIDATSNLFELRAWQRQKRQG